MIQLSGITLRADRDTLDNMLSAAARLLSVSRDDIISHRIIRRSIDARKKDNVKVLYTLALEVRGDENRLLKISNTSKYTPAHYEITAKYTASRRPVVVGSGPAGLLAALTLAQMGAQPLLIERGQPVEKRAESIAAFFAGGELDENSNVQFGEGGAGTFSDGKLTTGIKDVRMHKVIAEFVKAGAPEEIAWSNKPHIGTDRLRPMVAAIRRKIISLGGEVRFETQLVNITVKDDRLHSIIISNGGKIEEIACQHLILAIGHSARDTFEMLRSSGLAMERKPFSVGARVEHLQRDINRAQFGEFAACPALGAADYKLSTRLANGRGVYTFCMCPGGQVVAAASEKNSIVTNGMSLFARNSANANAALLVSVEPADFPGEDVLAGVEFQRQIERAAYSASGTYCAPAQLVGDFMQRRASTGARGVVPSYQPGVFWGSIECCLPSFVTDAMREALPVFERKIRGYASPSAVLTAPETRSSSPVRILRDDTLQSNVRGIFPCGEGAGYAGGIMSAAVDGIRCAEALAQCAANEN